MNEDKRLAIIPVFQSDINGIFINPSFCKNKLGNLKKINYPNFKYAGERSIGDKETGQEFRFVHYIEIINLPDNLIKEISNTINNLIQDTNKNVSEVIDEILDYFKKVTFRKEWKKELLGDLGEAIFILKSLEKGIDLLPYFRNEDNGLYDITVHGKNIEVKSSSPQKNDFIMNHEQLTQDGNRYIVIAKFKTLKSKMNILDIYKQISSYGKTLPNLLLEKQKKWEMINDLAKEESNSVNDIIDDFSVILDKCIVSLFKNEKLPIVNIVNKNALKEVEYTINCTDDELESIDNLYTKLDLKK